MQVPAALKRNGYLIGQFLICLSLTGCYERSTDGSQSTYLFAWWMAPLLFLIGLLGIAGGWKLRKRSAKWGFGLMFFALVMLILVVPAMLSDQVLIDDEHFEGKYGLWFSPISFNIRFKDVREIRLVARPGKYGRKKYELHCQMKSGRQVVVHAGDLVINTVDEVLARASAKGVSVLRVEH